MKIDLNFHLPDGSTVVLTLDEAKAVDKELKDLFEGIQSA